MFCDAGTQVREGMRALEASRELGFDQRVPHMRKLGCPHSAVVRVCLDCHRYVMNGVLGGARGYNISNRVREVPLWVEDVHRVGGRPEGCC